jgi:hypothetical protein
MNYFRKAFVLILILRQESFASNSSTCSYSATCSVGGIEGVCVSISDGCCGGTITSGLCPGSSDVKCCTSNACSTPSGNGICLQTSSCSGSSLPGYCTGPSEIQCCIGESDVVFGDNPYYYQNWCDSEVSVISMDNYSRLPGYADVLLLEYLCLL